MKKRLVILFFLVFIFLGSVVIKANSKIKKINILLYGLDGRESDKYERSDTIMLINYNFEESKAIVTSIPRDSYVKISCRNNKMDKINHAYVYGEIDYKGGGKECLKKSVMNLFGLNELYYVGTDIESLVKIIDQVGLLTIAPRYSFCQSNLESTKNYCFEKDKTILMDSQQALAYIRNRKSLPNGDISRSENQRQILKEILRKTLSSNLIDKMRILKYIKSNVETDINIQNYNLSSIMRMSKIDIDEYTLKGEGIVLDYYYYKIDEDNLSQLKKLYL